MSEVLLDYLDDEENATDEEIKKAFATPTEMTIFTYSGERDTIMSPLDSIRHYNEIAKYW